MNGLCAEPMAPQTFLYGCILEAGKEVVFDPEDDHHNDEHQLDLRMVCVDASTKDELHVVEVEGQDMEGQEIKATLVSLKPSTLPSVCLGGFTITPPATFRLKAGSGPIHISGQHLIMMSADGSFDEDDSSEEEEEEDVRTSKKRPAASPALKSQKKMKMEVEDDDDDDDDDDEEDMDDEDDDDEEESEDEESPVKAKATPSKPKTQNGSSSKPGTPAKKQVQTPKGKGEKSPKNPVTPKAFTVPEMKAKMMESIKKGIVLPKIQVKFENFVKNSYKVPEGKEIADLWKWRQTLADTK